MSPLGATGFNRDLVIESTADGAPYHAFAVELNPGEGNAFYESGLPGKSFGLPASRSFLSAADNETTFQFQDYTANNALVLSSSTGQSSGTLTLVTPGLYGQIAVLAHSASGGGVAPVRFNFSDGTSFITTYNAPDWFNNAGFGLQGVERINLNTGATAGAPDNPRFYQTTMDLAATLGTSNKTLVSVTFDQATAGATAIYAISGEIAGQYPAVITSGPQPITTNELSRVTFNVTVGGNPYPALLWYKNGNPIASATNSAYTITAAGLADQGTFRLVASNVVSNISHVVTSSVATLTIIADTNPPTLIDVRSQGLTQVLLRFSERINSASVTNLANFSVSGTNGNSLVSSTSLDASQSNLVLSVATLLEGAVYTVTANNLTDQSAAKNLTNVTASFTASVYTLETIGDPALASSFTLTNGGFNLAGGGSIDGGADQFPFSFIQRTGDFDFKVRLDSLTLADAWSKAGLLVREGLSPGARSAGIMATPSISGCFFQSRVVTNEAINITGSFPANYPNTWLRLKRSGNVFFGYASFDGQNWTQLGGIFIAMPSTVYFGFAIASQNADVISTAAFRDFSTVANAGVNGALAVERLGQSSRRTSLVLSEIMYHPANNALEYIEVFNSRGEFQDLSGYQIGGNIGYAFPAGTILPGGGFLVVAKSPSAVQTAYGISGVHGPFTGSLPNSSGVVTLINGAGAVFLGTEYSDESPWPAAADGAGHSLVLSRPSYGENNPLAWTASDSIGGSPGKLDPITPEAQRNVLINEFLAHTDNPDVDYIELYNHSTQPVDISGCVLTDDDAVDKFVIPLDTILPSRGFALFTETQLGFALSAEGETIYFKNAARTRVLDAVRFDGQENGIATGRFPDGGDSFYRLIANTPGTTNAAIQIGDIVINELMYHPISEDDEDQYVELHNRSASSVNLGGWELIGGIDFTFPPNTIISAGGYLVVARNAPQLLSKYPTLNSGNTLGNFSGRLSGRGERVALTMPDTIAEVVGGVSTVTTIHILMDEVTYNSGGRWPALADGGGSSLELIDSRSDRRLPSNWAASDETQKAPWTQVSATGTIDHGNVTADQLQVLLLGDGECLVDNVEVFSASSGNLIANSTFEGGATGWTAEGTQSQSSIENSEGFGSSRSYHIRAAKRGDNQINRIRTPLTSSLTPGTTNVTIRANVRWLQGHPEILLRLRGNWLECAGTMALPVGPGTPGARNSRFVTNSPPAITEVKHSPVLPAANQSIVITAKVHDPDGLSSVQVKVRIDPSVGYSTLNMNDAGTNGDAVTGDGTFSATVVGQSAGTTLAFYVQSADAFSASATATFPNSAPTRECLVRFGETQPTGNFPVYRIWMTQATQSTWTSRHKLDNTAFDVTFVLGDERVIYTAEALYAGSPYISGSYSGPTGNRCGYSIEVPKDDLFLGDTDLVLDWPGGHGNESTAMQEQLGYWIAEKLNLPFSHRYIIRLHVNGVTDEARGTVFEAAMQPGKRFVEQWLPENSDGQFFKIERAFEFNDSGGLIADPQPRLQNFTTTGGAKKTEKYRWNFVYRATDRTHDYTNIFVLANALNAPAPEPYTSATYAQVDVEEWMGIFAAEHIINNFDAYGHEIGKNMYAYKPDGGKWQLYMFDLDWLMLAAQNHGLTASSGPLFNSEDPTISRMYAFPPMARAYWRAVENAVNGPLDPANFNPVMDAKYNSLTANGIVWCDGNVLTAPTAVKTWFNQRRAFLQSQLATVTAPFSLNSTITTSNGVGTISGTAPVGVETVAINGTNWPVRWTTVSNWSATVPLQSGSNVFSVVGIDVQDHPVTGASNTASVVYGGAIPSPVGTIVINELMVNPANANAQYVELFNTSTNFTFDLSGWNMNELFYDFPTGTFLAPRSFLILAKDRVAFETAYGASIPVFDIFEGSLATNGQVVSLLKRGATPVADVVVDRVRYEADAPWPQATPGASLQVVDAGRDNSRVADWKANSSSQEPAWIYFSTNGTASSSTFYIYLQSAGDIYIDDMKLVSGSVPESGVNRLANGGFDSSLNGTWNLTANFSQSALNSTIKHSGNSSLHLIATAPGSGQNNSIFQNISPALVNGQTYALSFWYRPGTNGGGPLTVRLSGATGLRTTFDPNPASAAPFTPGTSNSVVAQLPEFPALWLNELQANNLTGPIDNAAQRDPWVELFNAGTNALNLAEYFLSDDYGDLTKWEFPANASVPAGGFLMVWCDNETNQNTSSVFHTNFRLPSGAGKVALSRMLTNGVQLVDYLTYTNLTANWSYGDFPSGQPFYRREMFQPTPGATNSNVAPPVNVFINEWMADNTHTLVDPADGGFEDWFEIYNPGTEAVDLGGYYVTDVLANKTKFLIPNNGHYKVPAGGFLLVWADNESIQNNTNTLDLHADFALGKSGEALGLFSADGTQIDAITFAAQTSDVSEGRFPNGTAAIISMTTPTPRASNVGSNSAPVLSPIADRNLTLGQTVSFTAQATDADQPPQTLTFSLGAGSPSGATIHSTSGQFSWTPNTAATNSISVIVTDNGTPSLSATQTFVVRVVLPPSISAQISGNQIQIAWSSGTLQQADNVAGPYTDVVTTSPYTVNMSATQKFFRLRL